MRVAENESTGKVEGNSDGIGTSQMKRFTIANEKFENGRWSYQLADETGSLYKEDVWFQERELQMS